MIYPGILRHLLGDKKTAKKYCQQAIDLMKNHANHMPRADGLIVQGFALSAEGNFQEAERAFQDAVTAGKETQRSRHAMEALAGLAGVAMAREKPNQAMNYVEEILDYLEIETPAMGHPLDGTIEPLRIYLTCYQVLKASQDPRSEEILKEAYDLLQKRAAKISDEQLRRCFLNNLAANREIVHQYESRSLE